MSILRLVTWNCRIGGFRKKASRMAPLRPDVLAVQEVEPIDCHPVFEGERQPTYRDRVGDPAYPRRAIGIFSYNDMELKPVDMGDPMYCFRRFEARRGNLIFHVAAVWTAATTSSHTSYRQAHDGIRRYADWIRQCPTVILGDFNANASFRGSNWRDLMALMKPLGLTSAYHYHFKEQFGAETRSTHFHKGNQRAGFHIDYCFLPDRWVPHIQHVEVGAYQDWHAISDHAPLIVDVALPVPST